MHKQYRKMRARPTATLPGRRGLPAAAEPSLRTRAEGYGVIGDFFVGVTLGSEVRRLLPRLVDAFSDHVVRTSASP